MVADEPFAADAAPFFSVDRLRCLYYDHARKQTHNHTHGQLLPHRNTHRRTHTPTSSIYKETKTLTNKNSRAHELAHADMAKRTYIQAAACS